MYVCMYVTWHKSSYVCVNMYVYVYIYIYIHAHTYIHTYIHNYIIVSGTYMYKSMCVPLHVCVCAYRHYLHLRTYLPIYLPTDMLMA